MILSTRATLLGTLAVSLVAWTPLAGASSHREAPAISERPKVDGTDLYMFRSYQPGRQEFVTILSNYQPLQAPYGGPNFFLLDPDAIYEIHIDNNGDSVEDITFQFNFDNPLQNGVGLTQTIDGQVTPIALRADGFVDAPNDPNLADTPSYTVTMITGDRRSGTSAVVTNRVGGSETFLMPLDNVGEKTIENYADYAQLFVHEISIPGCATPGKVFVGQRAEGFAVNLGPIFDLVNLVPIEGDNPRGSGNGQGFNNGITQDRSANEDVVDEFNVTSLALEVHRDCLTGTGNGVIGAWMTASLPQAEILDPSPTYEAPTLQGGAFVQVSRLGSPLVNELVIGLNHKDAFNASEPVTDVEPLIANGLSVAQFAQRPTLPALLESLFGVSAPTNFPRGDLVAAFATGIAPVNQQQIVTPGEMLRLNTTDDFGAIPTVRANQSTFGVAGDDLHGFPNGRRPGDDVVDIALRVVMGRLCHPVPVNGTNTDLNLCADDPAAAAAAAPAGLIEFTDGAPVFDGDANKGALEFQDAFPYLNDPIPGSPQSARP